MFDKKKIILNHIRASKGVNQRSNNFFLKISSMLIDRADLTNTKKYCILEIASRSNSLAKSLEKKKVKNILFQTIINKNIFVDNQKIVVTNFEDRVFSENTFDFCFCILSLNNSEKVQPIFKNVYNVLKKGGKFLTILPSTSCLKEFKYYFSNYFELPENKSFVPFLNIQSLGNLGTSSGFKDVIVDKEDFYLNISKPSEMWNFIRGVGESNYMLNRNKTNPKKSIFNKFLKDYQLAIIKNNLKHNTFTFNFFIGTK